MKPVRTRLKLCAVPPIDALTPAVLASHNAEECVRFLDRA